jgi:putative ABC transport system permease protein
MAMFKNYFKIAFRDFWKNKTTSCINIIGLTIGLTACLLISLYIRHELSYDSFEQNGSRIARVIMEYKFDGGGQPISGNFTSVRVASVFKKTFPEVEAAVKMVAYRTVVGYQDKLIDEKKFFYADPEFFRVFSFPLAQGNPQDVLAGPRRVVLSESTARRYFGHENPLGKRLRIGADSVDYLITGLAKDCPSNSQIKFDFLASFSSLGLTPDYENSYWDANYTTFLLLRNEASRASLQGRLPAFMKKEMAGEGATINFWLEAFSRIHLYSEYSGFEPNNNISYIYILAAVALLILVIASSTYINLSTARSIERAREVGVRKVMGAGKGQLFWQFIGESAILCMLSVFCSLVLASLLLPYFDQLTEKQLQVRSLYSLPFLGLSLLIGLMVSLAAGSYPALVLTGFQPVKVLKGSFKNTDSGQWLRKSLIVFQFAISVFLIVSTLVIQKQLYFIQHKELGYHREHVLVLPMNENMMDKLPLIKQEFKSDPDILSVSRCVRSPVDGGGGYNMRSAQMPSSEQYAVSANPVDEDFIKTLGLHLIAGEDLSIQDIKDVSVAEPAKRYYHFILNESAARQLGWSPAEAIGKKMFLDNSRPGVVKGVVQDFHFESLYHPIKPFVLFPELRARQLLVRISSQHVAQSLTVLETKWKDLVSDQPFEYRFLDDDFNKLYSSEIRLGKVMNLFSGIAVALACLGLFGLSAYAAQRRIKEIGIRKVLGASTGHIVLLLSGGFIKMAFLSLFIAFPLAWWGMKRWLQDFSYRTRMDGGIYLAAGCLVILLVLLTVAFQAVRAALANPVKNLRTE